MLLVRQKAGVDGILREISESRRLGRSLKFQDWHLEAGDTKDLTGLVEALVSWCKGTLSTCRRPYGIDLFDLIIAFRTEHEARPRSFRLDRLRPIELYQDSLPQALIDRLSGSINRIPSHLYVSAGLFSWGDAAHEALPNRA